MSDVLTQMDNDIMLLKKKEPFDVYFFRKERFGFMRLAIDKVINNNLEIKNYTYENHDIHKMDSFFNTNPIDGYVETLIKY